MKNKRAAYLIRKLDLQKHPEGGYFKEVYRSDEIIGQKNLPERYTSGRNYSTSIYFMIEGDDFSSFHRLESDELWHFYEGTAIKIIMIDKNGKLENKLLGTDFEKGENPVAVIKKATWFAAELVDKTMYSLIGCTVAPGFDFEDFTLAKSDDLIKNFPYHSEIIKKFTRK